MARRGVSLALFAAFVAVPIVEIALFIQVGGWIGLWPTLAIVVATALAGTVLMRAQGLAVLREMQSRIETRQNPARQVAEGVLILFAGALLLTPGFFTDACGLLLLVPPVRRSLVGGLWEAIKGRVVVHGAGTQPPPQDDIIEGEYEDVPPEGAGQPGDRPSGWTRPR